jgi:Tfp pilus assembly protein PilN
MSKSDKDSILRTKFPPEVEARKFNLVIYTGDLTITGSTVLTIDIRSSSRRTSDFIRTLKTQDFLTVGDVKVIDRPKNKIVDKPEYILVNLAQVDAIYAEDNAEVLSEGKEPETQV